MRLVRKSQPSSNAIRGGNWHQAALNLRQQLDPLEPERRTPAARAEFDDLVVKPQAREAVAEEQEGLCVFCESRLSVHSVPDRNGQPRQDSIRLAHWAPVDASPYQALSWSNLFGSCSRLDSCDVEQRSRSPGMGTAAAQDWSIHLVFHSDGQVSPAPSAPPELASAIQEYDAGGVWNLNAESLNAARKAAIDAELTAAHDERDRRRVAKAVVIDERIQVLDREPLQYQSAVLQALKRWR